MNTTDSGQPPKKGDRNVEIASQTETKDAKPRGPYRMTYDDYVVIDGKFDELFSIITQARDGEERAGQQIGYESILEHLAIGKMILARLDKEV